MDIGIIGAGKIGAALAVQFTKAGHRVATATYYRGRDRAIDFGPLDMGSLATASARGRTRRSTAT
jgi:2-polyprenyl-6-methoxyphenol hydroxylase-like FAD-dependent oxidoreductase